MWPLGEPMPCPLLHWNCPVRVPITKTWEQLAKRNKALAAQSDEIDPGSRASMGGPGERGHHLGVLAGSPAQGSPGRHPGPRPPEALGRGEVDHHRRWTSGATP